MSLIIKKNTTFKIPRTPPISFLGLSLWLKADAGVTLGISQIIISDFTGIYAGANGTYNYNYEENWWELSGTSYRIESNGSLVDDNDQTVIATNNNNFQGAWTPTNYFSTITLSNAGEDVDQGGVVVNGVYTRSDAGGPFASFTASGGRSIDWDQNDGNFWETSGGWYRNYGPLLNVSYWETANGEEPAPTAVNSTSVRNVGSPTSTTVSDLVTAWADQSGNGNNASQGSEFLPTYALIGGKSFISFQSNVSLAVNSIWNGVQFVGTIFIVVRFESSAQAENLLGQEAVAYGYGLAFGRKYNGTNAFAVTTDFIDVVNSSSLAGDNTSYLLGTTFSESLIAILYLNGASAGSGAIANMIGSQYAGTVIGGGSGSSNIAEVVVYNRVLTTSERQQVEAYLNSKYQIY